MFQKERQKTAGDGWFGMRAPELTDELKNDLKALKMRASMDPKRFYKKNDRDGFPKYFQVYRQSTGYVVWEQHSKVSESLHMHSRLVVRVCLGFIMTLAQLSQPPFYNGSSKGGRVKMVAGIKGSFLKLTEFLYLDVLLVLT